MSGSRGVIIALCGAVAVLALVVGFWRSGSEPTSPFSRSGQSAGDAGGGRDGEQRFDAAPDSGSGAGGPGGGPGGGGAPGRAGGSGPAGDRERMRRRLAAVAAARNAQSGASGSGSGTGRSAGLEGRDDPGRNLKLNRDNVPKADSPGVQSAEGAEEDAAEEVSDVAYEGGADKVFDTDKQVQIDDAAPISAGAGSITFWIEPQWSADGPADATLVQIGDNGLQILKQGDTLRFQYVASNGQVYGGSGSIANWNAGDWRHVAATWQGGTLALYVDGTQQFLNGAPGGPELHGNSTLYVGSALPGGAPAAPGKVSYLTVLNRPVTPEEITQMFESGGAPDK